MPLVLNSRSGLRPLVDDRDLSAPVRKRSTSRSSSVWYRSRALKCRRRQERDGGAVDSPCESSRLVSGPCGARGTLKKTWPSRGSPHAALGQRVDDRDTDSVQPAEPCKRPLANSRRIEDRQTTSTAGLPPSPSATGMPRPSSTSVTELSGGSSEDFLQKPRGLVDRVVDDP